MGKADRQLRKDRGSSLQEQLFESRRALINAQRIVALLVLREGGRVRIDIDELKRLPEHATFRARMTEDNAIVLETVDEGKGAGG